jgi:hypothetical protein
MQKKPLRALAALALAGAFAGCAGIGGGGWVPLVNGAQGLDNFNRVGEANWAAMDGAIQATQGAKEYGYLVSKSSFRDFVLRAEFWASDDANSGVFLRCQDPRNVNDENCYEANIFDQRADPTYGTGAITKVAPVSPMPKAGGKWNTYEITAQDDHLVLVLNGVKTVDVHNAKFASGPVALQWARGTIKFRKVEIKPL